MSVRFPSFKLITVTEEMKHRFETAFFVAGKMSALFLV